MLRMAVTSEAPSRFLPQFWKRTMGSLSESTRMRSHTVMRFLACCFSIWSMATERMGRWMRSHPSFIASSYGPVARAISPGMLNSTFSGGSSGLTSVGLMGRLDMGLGTSDRWNAWGCEKRKRIVASPGSPGKDHVHIRPPR